MRASMDDTGVIEMSNENRKEFVKGFMNGLGKMAAVGTVVGIGAAIVTICPSSFPLVAAALESATGHSIG